MSEANPGSLLPSGTDLPKYSTDLSTTLAGRVISRSSFTQSTAVSSSDYSKFVDWAADVKETYYAGNGVLSLWIARTDAERTEPLKLEATLYAYKKDGKSYTRTAQGSPASVTIPAGETPCVGNGHVGTRPAAAAPGVGRPPQQQRRVPGRSRVELGPEGPPGRVRRSGRLPREPRDLGKKWRWPGARSIRTDAGMTLVELMVAMTLLLGVSTMIVMFVSSTVRVQIHNDDENRGLSDAKVILDRLARDIGPPVPPPAMTPRTSPRCPRPCGRPILRIPPAATTSNCGSTA